MIKPNLFTFNNNEILKPVSYRSYTFGLKYAVFVIDKTSTFTPIVRVQVPERKTGKITYKTKRILIDNLDVKAALVTAITFVYSVVGEEKGSNFLDTDEFCNAIKWSQMKKIENIFIDEIYKRIAKINTKELKLLGFNFGELLTINTKKTNPKYISVAPISNKTLLDVRMGGSKRARGLKYIYCVKNYHVLCQSVANIVAQLFFLEKIKPKYHDVYILSVFIKLNGDYIKLVDKHCVSTVDVKKIDLDTFIGLINEEYKVLTVSTHETFNYEYKSLSAAT